MALKLRAQNIKKFVFFTILFVFLLFFTYLISICVGTSMLSIKNVISCFLGAECENTVRIIIGYRFIRSSTALLTGAILALSGTLIQTIARNPLAEPYILGLSSTALTILSASILLWPSIMVYRYVTIIIAFVGAMIGYIITTVLSMLAKSTSYSLILSGIAITSIFSGVAHVLLYMVQNKLKSPYYLLLMGSTAIALMNDVLILAFVLFCCVFLLYLFGLPRKLNAYIFGDSFAKQLGYNPKTLTILTALLISIMTGASVAVVGIVGFVGLAAPHIARLTVNSSDHRIIIILSMFLGSILTTLADIITRLLAIATTQGEFPLGVVTSMIGAPFLAYLIVKSGRK